MSVPIRFHDYPADNCPQCRVELDYLRRHLAPLLRDALRDLNQHQPATPPNCSHCRDEPPAGHTCPRCGVATISTPTDPNGTP